MSSMFEENPVMYVVYWAALKKSEKFSNLQEWAEITRRAYGDRLDYPFKEAIELIEKYRMKKL